MSDSEVSEQVPDVKNRKLGLTIFGSFQILAGALCALMVPFMVVGMVASSRLASGPAMDVSMMLPALFFYVALAVWFIWMGIGSIMARRWARALILVSSWVWLVSGASGFVVMLAIMPGMFRQMGASGVGAPGGLERVVMCVMIAFMAFFYIVAPGVLVLFYRSRHVKATCEAADPRIRWTDRCPLPVLALTLMFCAGVVFMPCAMLFGSVIPLFGTVLSGLPGALVLLAVTVVLAYLTWGTYKLRPAAWWGALVLVVLGGLSGVITFSRLSLMDLYEKASFSEQQMAAMRQVTLPGKLGFSVYTGLCCVAFLGYLLYVRRYFIEGPAVGSCPPPGVPEPDGQ